MRFPLLLAAAGGAALFFSAPLVGAAGPLSPGPVFARSDGNSAVLAAIKTMPDGGKYAASQAAFAGLGRSVALGPEGLVITPKNAQPSFCSGATYLVFLQALETLSRQGSFRLDDATLTALLVRHQPDGQGIWGRWNANGPGTARLFYELRLGRNFTDYSEARPGDFMKILWSNEIGSREHGHSVIYLGTEESEGKSFVRFWSSNVGTSKNPSGYGEKRVPRTKIAHAIFSRLESPENLDNLASLPRTDAFLASMLKRGASIEEVGKMCGF